MVDSEYALHKAQQAAELGNYDQARSLLMQLLHADPNNRHGWLLLSEVVTKPEHAIKALERVLTLDPGNETARLRLAELTGQPAEPEPAFSTTSLFAYQESGWQPASGAQPAGGEAGYAPGASPWPYVETGEENPDHPEQPAVPAHRNGKDSSAWGYVESNPAAVLEMEAAGKAAAGEPATGWDAWQQAEDEPRAAEPTPIPDWMAPQPKPAQPPEKKKGARWEFALIAVLALTAICIFGLVVAPKAVAGLASGSLAAAAPTDEEILAVINTNIIASNREDYDLYMRTIHSQSPSYTQTGDALEGIFSQFDLTYEVSGLEVLQASSREAKVAFTLTTRKVRGPDFRDNRISGEMFLRPEDGAWKIYNQKVDTVEYLD